VSASVTIALDAMGGDHAPGVVLKGADIALVRYPAARFLLFGDEGRVAPLLAKLPRDGQSVPVVIQGNKTGFIYVLNRETGTPVWPVEEKQVPQSDVQGEKSAPTQPFPATLPALTPQRFSAADAWGPTAADRNACRSAFEGVRN